MWYNIDNLIDAYNPDARLWDKDK